MATRTPTEPVILRPGQAAALISCAIGLSAIWLFPLVTGSTSVFMAVMAWLRGERRALRIIPVALACAALGLFLETLPRSFFT
ncbi:MAG: hypothetical protein QOG03_1048 [Actinomycetota bacterium]|nr:hypothetical protein [Actinomycetota bacterium]